MKIFLNGDIVESDQAETVHDLIVRHGLAPETTLVEWNGVALARADWAAQKLQENDRLEVLRVAAGG